MDLITLTNVTLGYGGTPVLRGVDLGVGPGDFLGLVGPNGAGKTTLLRAIIGLIKPMEGRLKVADGVTLGYVPQVQNLDTIYPLTVREVVRMGGYHRFRRMPANERLFLGQCLDEVGMRPQADILFSRLSGGQRQRVLVARALFTRPDVLLLDEPTSGADHMAEQRVMDLLRRLNGDGRTILLICHELDAVQRAVREVLWVSRGKVVRHAQAALLSESLIKEMYEPDV
jgi:ABC-type Mn2+/Zn2+ transport system ATPase subunit